MKVYPGLVAGPQVLTPSVPSAVGEGAPVSSLLGRAQRTHTAHGHQALQRQDINSWSSYLCKTGDMCKHEFSDPEGLTALEPQINTQTLC